MRITPRHVAAAVLGTTAAWLAPGLATGAGSSGPTQAQIAAAVARVRHSPHLWATVNACDTRRQPHTIGIRAQMPALAFPARLYMRLQVDFWNGKRFVPVPGSGARYLARLGIVSAGYEQGGKTFKFAPHSGRLRGTVTFEWYRSGRRLASVVRHTTPGHHNADDGDPPGHSAATCAIR